MVEIEDLLEETRKRLVETGSRNRLIHVNRNAKRGSQLNIINERSDDIFQILKVHSKKMRFAATDVSSSADDDEDDFMIPIIPDSQGSESRYTDKFLETRLAPDALQKRLLKIFRDSRTAEEEQGINILYLAVGFLSWFESQSSEVQRNSPLVLLPVELVRNDRNSTFDIRIRDDDLISNLPLQERLKGDFGIVLPDIEEDEDWVPSSYFETVKDAVSGQSRWSVDENGIQLGFFSFAKLLMLRDLDPENWNAGELVENVLIKGLLSDGFESDPPLFPEDKNLDEVLDPADLLHVIDADASQTKVIEEVKAGRNLVVQGPPGTGKSQTITNIISNAVHEGKTVLFVAEKMAALEVVHNRMVKAGLSNLCLELHSKTANKKNFLNELAKTIAAAKKGKTNPRKMIHGLRKTRDALNKYCNAMHLPIPDREYSPYEVLSKMVFYINKDVPIPKFNASDFEQIPREKESEIRSAIESYVVTIQTLGAPTDNPFSGSENLDLQPTDIQRLVNDAGNSLVLVNELRVLQEEVGELIRRPIRSIKNGDDYASFLNNVKEIPSRQEDLLLIVHENAILPRFLEAVDTAIRWVGIKRSIENTFSPTVWSLEPTLLRSEIHKGMSSWVSRWFGKYRSVSKELSSYLKGELVSQPEARLALVDNLINANEVRKKYENEEVYLKSTLNGVWRGEETPFTELIAIANWFKLNDIFLKEYDFASFREVLDDSRTDLFDAEKILHHSARSRNSYTDILKLLGMEDGSSIENKTIADVKAFLSNIHDNPNRYDEWVRLQRTRKSLIDLGLSELLLLIENGSIQPVGLSREFFFALNEVRWKYARSARKELQEVIEADRNKLVSEFNHFEEDRLKDVQQYILESHLDQVPTGASGEMGLIRGEIAKKRSHRPIRKMMSNAGAMIQRIKPVFLMSPISVAQYLPPGVVEFDLLLIDEASQVRPEDALGSIARCKQIVVVGDQKQLAPTSFFDRLIDSGDAEDNEEEEEVLITRAIEMESILTLCDARGLNRRMLEWHYRSRDPSLIKVSNVEFYDSRLILPPSPTQGDPEFGIRFTRVPGVYYRGSVGEGRPRTNRIEANHVVDRVKELARSKPNFSVGVVAFSKTQADLITEVFEYERREDKVLDEFLRENRRENVFIKNIENVQGDERDIILISVGYGPSEQNGRLTSMNFGPVNTEGGERRLNVLFTRARSICEVFCSFDPGDIDLSRTTKEGPRVLKRFLQYAHTGDLGLTPSSDGEPDSPFEEDVADVIRSLGYLADHQVGSAGFKIDLGVKRKRDVNHYLLAVECDGATYHSALWARERDRLRQEVLENMGWRFHRIWSTDWFYSREREIERLKSALIEAEESGYGSSISGSNHLAAIEDEGATNVDETVVLPEAKKISLPLYERAKVNVGRMKEPHERYTKNVAEIVTSIVQQEGLIHTDEVARRYTEAHGKSKTGSRIKGKVEEGLRWARGEGSIESRDGFWGTMDQFTNPTPRNRGQESGSIVSAEYIPMPEIEKCIELIRAESGMISEDELVKEVASVLGFRRVGPDLRSRIEQVV
jgi:hypothetical protein